MHGAKVAATVSVLLNVKLCYLSQATVGALAKFLLILSWTLQTASANVLYHRLALTTLFFKAIITLLGWNMSRKIQIFFK